MTDLSQLILEEYQVRKTRKQKDNFIDLMKSHYPELQTQQSGLLKSRNLVLGDPENAKIILGAHYDTCARMIIPNFITPKNPILSILYSLVLLIPMAFVAVLLNLLLSLLTDSFWVHYIITVILWLAFMYVLMAGPANPHTVNDNTSGVLVLCQMLEKMTPEQREKTAVVFFDNEELGLVGSSRFRKAYKKNLGDKLLVNFDCVSDGDHLLIASSKKARNNHEQSIIDSFVGNNRKRIEFANSEKIYYPSDQSGFPQHIAVAALKQNRLLGLYMDRIHTAKDTVLDEENLDLICECTKKQIDYI